MNLGFPKVVDEPSLWLIIINPDEPVATRRCRTWKHRRDRHTTEASLGLARTSAGSEFTRFENERHWRRSSSPLELSAQAASRHSYRWCSPPTRGSATTLAVEDGRGVAALSFGVSLWSPKWQRSSW